ncbi:ABC-F family ATP-binding cassette domain-containing protein [Candidatus Roizmanbacteria bacterium]|nr:ABC-F family ATP-binding cassette domain-containing protein [Candidatus Roizmanbacteria bacterium]
MIFAKELCFSYGSGLVFDRVNFAVGNNQKVGLVGPNGAGKSTLFKLIQGTEEPDSGIISVQGTIGYVPQEVKHDVFLEQSSAIRDYIDPHRIKKDFELKKLLSGLELSPVSVSSLPQKLSGGQKTKLALARALIAEPDILLLDEPTNFMDTQGKLFVMNFLSRYKKTLIVVSHDLKLLDKSVDKILFINTQFHHVETYTGTYSDSQKLIEEKEKLLKRTIKAKQQHIKRMEQALPKLYKLTSDKGVRARVRQQERIRREKEKLPPMPQELKKFSLRLPDPPRSGELPIRIRDISHSYEKKKVLSHLSFSVQRNERIILIGPNGAGKSTLIKVIMKLLKPNEGTVEYDERLMIGYYSQEFESLDPEKTMLSTVLLHTEITEQKARSFLARFLFDHSRVKQKVKELSGGEKTRLAMALLILNNYSMLVLDEPTTYLDPLSQRVVLESLKAYRGTLLLVSHSEDFVKELQPHRALILPAGKLVLWSEELLDQLTEI